MDLPEEPPAPPAAPGFGRLRYSTQRSIGIPVMQSFGDGKRRRLFEDGRQRGVRGLDDERRLMLLNARAASGASGRPKLTNEVQHRVKVLSWESVMARSPLKSGVRLPAYKPRGGRSGRSLQIWVARHRPWLGS